MFNVGGSSSGPKLRNEMEKFQKRVVNPIEKETEENRVRTDS